MELRFYAKTDLLVPVPEVYLIVGAPHKYVGRYHDPANRAYPATGEHASFDSESKEGRRLKKIVKREQCLFPADKETAKACGIPFEKITFLNGSWVLDIPAVK